MDPTPAAVEAEFPGWHIWPGTHGQRWYAQGPAPSYAVISDENLTELRAAIAAAEGIQIQR